MAKGSREGRKKTKVGRVFCVLPGHLWDEKGLQRQDGVGPLVSFQERIRSGHRSADVVNWLLTAGFVPPSVYIRFYLFIRVFRKRRRSTSQHPGTNSDCRPADKLVVNRLSNAVLFLHRFTLGFSCSCFSRTCLA